MYSIIWKIGRVVSARFQWSRPNVCNLEPCQCQLPPCCSGGLIGEGSSRGNGSKRARNRTAWMNLIIPGRIRVLLKGETETPVSAVAVVMVGLQFSGARMHLSDTRLIAALITLWVNRTLTGACISCSCAVFTSNSMKRYALRDSVWVDLCPLRRCETDERMHSSSVQRVCSSR
jgi:hypothetical protein